MTKHKYLPMVVPNSDFDKFGWTRKHSEIDSYLRAQFALWKDSANHALRLLLENSGLCQGKIYGEILHNIEKLKGQVE